MLLTLAMAPWITNLLILVLLGVAVLLVLTVLIQRPQGGGLSAAFGSAGSGQTAFGTKTGDALTVFTVIMFSVFVLAAIALNYMMRPEEAGAGAVLQPTSESAPATGGQADPNAPANSAAPGVDVTPVTPPTTLPATDPAGNAPQQPAPADAPAPPPEQPPQQPQPEAQPQQQPQPQPSEPKGGPGL